MAKFSSRLAACLVDGWATLASMYTLNVRALLLFIGLLAGGCSLFFSEGTATDADGPVDASIDAAVTCECEATEVCQSDGSCAARCDDISDPGEADDFCAEQATGDPYCSRGRCVECTAHAQCESDACNIIDGQCIPTSATVRFVDAPSDFLAAFGPSSTGDPVTVIIAPRTYSDERIAIAAGQFHIIAEGATLAGEAQVSVTMTAEVKIDFLTITATPETTNRNYSVSCAGDAAELHLRETAVVDVTKRGIAADCNLFTAERIEVLRAAKGGIDIGDKLSADGIDSRRFDIKNSVIANSGRVAGDDPLNIQGVFLRAGATGTLAMSTIVGNGAPLVDQIRCESGVGAHTLEGNIVWGLRGEGLATSGCVLENSNVEGAVMGSNINPMLGVSFRPTAASPAQQEDVTALDRFVNAGDLDRALQVRDPLVPDMGAFEAP